MRRHRSASLARPQAGRRAFVAAAAEKAPGRRIENCEQGKELLEWLNGLPGVLAILKEHKARLCAPFWARPQPGPASSLPSLPSVNPAPRVGPARNLARRRNCLAAATGGGTSRPAFPKPKSARRPESLAGSLPQTNPKPIRSLPIKVNPTKSDQIKPNPTKSNQIRPNPTKIAVTSPP